MAKTMIFRFRLTRSEFEELKLRSQSARKSSISAFIRSSVFEQQPVIDKVCEMSKMLKIALGEGKKVKVSSPLTSFDNFE